MKREGRMHGCNLRVGRRQWECGQKVPSKPTNQSRNSSTHAVVNNCLSNLVFTESELPSQKSIGKTKSAWKAKDLDITRNHLMQDWKIYENSPDGSSQQHSRNSFRDRWECDSDDEDVPQGDVDQEMEEREAFGRPVVMVLPIESLLRQRKTSSSKASSPSVLRADVLNEGSIDAGLGTDNDDALSWYDLDFSEDHMVEEWFLVTEAELL